MESMQHPNPVEAYIKGPITRHNDGSVTMQTVDGRTYSFVVRDPDAKQVILEENECSEVVKLVLKILEEKHILIQNKPEQSSLDRTRIDAKGVHTEKKHIKHTEGIETAEDYKKLNDLICRHQTEKIKTTQPAAPIEPVEDEAAEITVEPDSSTIPIPLPALTPTAALISPSNIVELENKIKLLTQENANLLRDMHEAKHETERVKEANMALGRKFDDAYRRLDEIQNTLSEAVSKLQAQVDDLQQQNHQLIEQTQQLGRQPEPIFVQTVTAAPQVNDFEAQLEDNLIKKGEEIREMARQHGIEIDTSPSLLSELDPEAAASLEARLEAYHSQTREILERLISTDEAAPQEANIYSSKEEIQELKQQLANMSQKLVNANEHRNEGDQRIEDLERANSELKAANAQLKLKVAQNSPKLVDQEASSEKSIIERQLEELSRQVEKLQRDNTKLSELTNNLYTEKSKNLDEIGELKNHNQEILRQLRETRNREAQLKEEFDVYQTNGQAAIEKAVQKEQEARQLAANALRVQASLEQELGNLRKENEQLWDHVRELETRKGLKG